MFFSQLSALDKQINTEQISSINSLLSSLTPNSILTLSQFIKKTNLDIDTAKNVLKKLCDEKVLIQGLAVRCPECDLILKLTTEMLDIDQKIYCYKCEEYVETSSDNIEVIYAIANFPFEDGQQYELDQFTVAQAIDILSSFLDCHTFNGIFYNPTDIQYKKLDELYDDVFANHDTTTKHGNALENLTRYLFNLCIQYKSSKLRTELNDIDCFVRSSFTVKGSILSELGSSIFVECKNEEKNPGMTYFQKLQSILMDHEGHLGIIVCKSTPPRTYFDAAKKLYNRFNIIIITIDGEDLKRIVKNKQNLLECIEMKACEIRMQAIKDFSDCGLFSYE